MKFLQSRAAVLSARALFASWYVIFLVWLFDVCGRSWWTYFTVILAGILFCGIVTLIGLVALGDLKE